MAAHEQRIQALLDGNLDSLAEVVGEDMVFVSASGVSQTRAQVFAAARAGELRIERMDCSDFDIRIYGDVGILAYTADGRSVFGDAVVEGITRSTTVYVERAGQWQMVSQHQSRIE